MCLGQSSSNIMTPEVRRVGQKLACLCRSCKNTVGDCPMLECHYAKPHRDKIGALQKLGMSDQEIVDSIVKTEGKEALSSPPAEGFHLIAWVMPFAAAGVGLVVLMFVLQRLKRQKAAAESAPEIDPAMLDRIEKDLAKLD